MWRPLVLLALAASPYGLTVGDAGTARPQVGEPPPAVCRPNVLPEPERTCSTDADCTTVEQVVNCCGTLAIKGAAVSDVSRFSAEDRRCNPGRRCGCEAGPAHLDDGSVVRNEDRRPVLAACHANRCRTEHGQASAPGQRPGGLTSDEVERLPHCERDECGPAPLYPTATCPDGRHQSGRGPCVRIEGACRWARMVCPVSRRQGAGL